MWHALRLGIPARLPPISHAATAGTHLDPLGELEVRIVRECGQGCPSLVRANRPGMNCVINGGDVKQDGAIPKFGTGESRHAFRGSPSPSTERRLSGVSQGVHAGYCITAFCFQ